MCHVSHCGVTPLWLYVMRVQYCIDTANMVQIPSSWIELLNLLNHKVRLDSLVQSHVPMGMRRPCLVGGRRGRGGWNQAVAS